MLETSVGKVRVLIVDDEPEIREVLCDLLGADYECAAASSAEEALAMLERGEKFNLIISDITMSGMTGLEMIPHVIKSSP
ncbi:MAG: response regulator, partial [Pyrinomonadaceae bacterium]